MHDKFLSLAITSLIFLMLQGFVRSEPVVNDIFEFGEDYAITLEKWLARFEEVAPALASLGYSESFIRKWRFYLTSCAGMFRAGGINVMQVELVRS